LNTTNALAQILGENLECGLPSPPQPLSVNVHQADWSAKFATEPPVVDVGICGVEFFNHPWELGHPQSEEFLFSADENAR
jgi:hypothetical protein